MNRSLGVTLRGWKSRQRNEHWAYQRRGHYTPARWQRSRLK